MLVCYLFSVPAVLTNVSGDKTIRERSNLHLFCEASGKPTPNITWTKVLTDSRNSGVLHQGPTWDFTNISRTDSGTYHCTAFNELGGSDRRAINVNVTCKYTSDTYHALLRTHINCHHCPYVLYKVITLLQHFLLQEHKQDPFDNSTLVLRGYPV